MRCRAQQLRTNQKVYHAAGCRLNNGTRRGTTSLQRRSVGVDVAAVDWEEYALTASSGATSTPAPQPRNTPPQPAVSDGKRTLHKLADARRSAPGASASQPEVPGSSATDPATTLVFNARTREIHLNKLQSEALFQARSELYRSTLRKVVTVLQSHLTPVEKCHRLMLLHDQAVIPQKIRLRTDTYEEIFHLFYAVATSGAFTSDKTSGTAQINGRTLESEVDGGHAMRDIHAQTSPFLNPVWTMYRYMVDSGTEPSRKIVQHVMGMLSRVQNKSIDVEARAHSLMLDCDRLSLRPSEYTLSDYCRVCAVNGAMHLALARVTDTLTRHEAPPSANVATMLLHGLTTNGHHAEALRFVSTLQSVALTTQLLNAVLHAASYSNDPSSAFAFYQSVKGSGIRPTQHTIGILVKVVLSYCAQPNGRTGSASSHVASGGRTTTAVGRGGRSDAIALRRATTIDQHELRQLIAVVVRDMLRYRVRVNHRVLNHILACFAHVGNRKGFVSLCRTMAKRWGRRSVFEEQYPPEWVAAAQQ